VAAPGPDNNRVDAGEKPANRIGIAKDVDGPVAVVEEADAVAGVGPNDGQRGVDLGDENVGRDGAVLKFFQSGADGGGADHGGSFKGQNGGRRVGTRTRLANNICPGAPAAIDFDARRREGAYSEGGSGEICWPDSSCTSCPSCRSSWLSRNTATRSPSDDLGA